MRRLNVDGGAIDGWSSVLLLRVVAPSDELRFDLLTGEKGTVRSTTGGDGRGRGGPAGIWGHSGIVGKSDLDNDLRICGFSIGNGYCTIGCELPLFADDEGRGGSLPDMAATTNGCGCYFVGIPQSSNTKLDIEALRLMTCYIE